MLYYRFMFYISALAPDLMVFKYSYYYVICNNNNMSNNQHTSTAKSVQQTVTNIYEIGSTLPYACLTSLDIESYSVLSGYNKYTRAINHEK